MQPRHHQFSLGLASLGVLMLTTGVCSAAAAQCARCGCAAACQKVCRLVCEEKEVEVVCWSMEREAFCIPCPGQCQGKHCDVVCLPSPDDGERCAAPKKFVWREWLPPCGAKLFEKKKLLKKVEKKKVPTYKFVVEELCPQCRQRQAGAGRESPAPTADANLGVKPVATAEPSRLPNVRPR